MGLLGQLQLVVANLYFQLKALSGRDIRDHERAEDGKLDERERMGRSCGINLATCTLSNVQYAKSAIHNLYTGRSLHQEVQRY